MGIDAVCVLKLKKNGRKLLKQRLEAAGVSLSCLKPLEKSAVLFSTFLRFGDAAKEPAELHAHLSALFGNDLARIHDDARGVLVFPDACEPRGRTYAAVVSEVEAAGVWIPTT